MKKISIAQILAVLASNATLLAKFLTPSSIDAIGKIVAEYQKDASDGFISVEEGFQLGDDVLALLEADKLTIADERALLAAVKPLFVQAKS